MGVDHVIARAVYVRGELANGGHVRPGSYVRSHAPQPHDPKAGPGRVIQQVAFVARQDRHLESIGIKRERTAQRDASRTGDEPGHDDSQSDTSLGPRHD